MVVAGRTAESLEGTVSLLEGSGGKGSSVVADVAVGEDVARIVSTAVERHGSFHGLQQRRRGWAARPIDQLDEEVWNTVIATNLTGVWQSMKHEIAWMREHGGGAIVDTASNVGAHLSRPNMGACAATKAAVSTLTRVAALECIADGIRINAISPGATNTPMSKRPGESDEDRAARIASTIPIGRLGSTEEVASAVLWLSSEESAFMVGHDMVLDGGASA